MSTFQILMFAATLFFAYQIFRHVQQLDDSLPQESQESERNTAVSSASSLTDQADSAYERGAIEEAKTYLEEALSLESHNPEIMNKLAFVTAKSGDRINAIELYEVPV